MALEDKTPNTPVQTENIFEEFANIEAQEDIQVQADKRGLYEYLSIGNKVLMILNICILCFLFIWFIYSYIQKNIEKNQYSYFAPICHIFLGDIASNYAPSNCYNVYGAYSDLETQVEQVTKQQTQQITPLLSELYGLENFNYSKKVRFLLDSTVDRMKPLTMLQEFDTLKNTYSPIDKSEIQCYDIIFSDKRKMKMNCDAYSSDWDTAIAGLDDGVLVYDFEGSSITRASSFMNYIEKAPGSSFSIISQTENLNHVSVNLWPYTQKTNFQLELEYSPQNISL